MRFYYVDLLYHRIWWVIVTFRNSSFRKHVGPLRPTENQVTVTFKVTVTFGIGKLVGEVPAVYWRSPKCDSLSLPVLMSSPQVGFGGRLGKGPALKSNQVEFKNEQRFHAV
jgi:hypothetical protein